jgi:UDP-N-acetylglucosamine 1-carboxyvinyltransferase
VIPDRIEAGSLLIAGPITGGDVTVENAVANDLRPLLDKLIEAGVGIEEKPNNVIRAYAKGRFSGVRIETEPFPGFPTDMQAQMMSLLTLANGPSIVAESIFENRFMHANELMRMGANIKIENRYAIIEGVPELSGADVKITDLRAGAALILAGLAAKGSSGIYGLKHLKRGYENLPEKLRQLGADITNEL